MTLPINHSKSSSNHHMIEIDTSTHAEPNSKTQGYFSVLRNSIDSGLNFINNYISPNMTPK
jgi:hypothetical protein